MKNYSGYEVVWDEGTPSEVIKWIERAREDNRRVRIFMGDTERADFEKVHGHKPDPGKDWGEEFQVTGTIGISTGWKPCALLIHNSRSMGGGAISTSCIVRMFIQGRGGWQEVYKHPNYHSHFDTAEVVVSELAPEYSHAVKVSEGDYLGEIARFHSERAAKNYLAFMRGERMSK
jgi:hypothetical protein